MSQDKQKLKEFITTKTALKKILKEILYTEERDKHSHEDTEKNKS
jgi:hypothetical protein